MAKSRTPSRPIETRARGAASRRDVLRGIPVAGLAAAAVAAIPGPADGAEAADPRKVTFEENSHVRRFYALARR